MKKATEKKVFKQPKVTFKTDLNITEEKRMKHIDFVLKYNNWYRVEAREFDELSGKTFLEIENYEGKFDLQTLKIHFTYGVVDLEKRVYGFQEMDQLNVYLSVGDKFAIKRNYDCEENGIYRIVRFPNRMKGESRFLCKNLITGKEVYLMVGEFVLSINRKMHSELTDWKKFFDVLKFTKFN